MAMELAKRVSGDVTIIDIHGRCTLGDETEHLDRELKKVIDERKPQAAAESHRTFTD